MLIWIFLGLFAAAGSLAAAVAPEAPTPYYVQFIRGSNDNRPPAPNAKPIGPKLSERLRPVFAWKHYWEVNLQAVQVGKQRPARVRVSPELEVQLTVLNQSKLEMQLVREGKSVQKIKQEVKAATFEIMGGSREGDNSWFVVVRRDKPEVPGE